MDVKAISHNFEPAPVHLLARWLSQILKVWRKLSCFIRDACKCSAYTSCVGHAQIRIQFCRTYISPTVRKSSSGFFCDVVVVDRFADRSRSFVLHTDSGQEQKSLVHQRLPQSHQQRHHRKWSTRDYTVAAQSFCFALSPFCFVFFF